MDVHEIKRVLRGETSYLKDGWDKIDRPYIEARMNKVLNLWEGRKGIAIDPDDKATAIKQLSDDFSGYGPVQDLLDDPEVTEIMINGPHKVYVERNGNKELTSAVFDDDAHLDYVVNNMIAPSGRRVDEASPCVDFSLPDGSRVNVTIPPLSVGCTSVTIRKLLDSMNTLEAIVEFGTLDVRMANFLVHCLRGRLNMIFSGATGTGKTTTINILSAYIDEGERIVTIEDTLELSLRQGNTVKLLTRPPDLDGKGHVSIRYLFTNALRMRPSRILLGEIRGSEAMDYIQALNSGHKGTLAVLHAATPRDAITRLETLAMYAGLDLPSWSIRRQIASGLDVIVQHEQLPDGSRKIICISEVTGVEDDQIVLKDIYRYEIEETSEESGTKGKFLAVAPPTFRNALARNGIHMEDKIFVND